MNDIHSCVKVRAPQAFVKNKAKKLFVSVSKSRAGNEVADVILGIAGHSLIT